MGKVMWKPLELPVPRKIVRQKQYCTPGGTAEISATIKDLQDVGVVILTETGKEQEAAPLQLEQDQGPGKDKWDAY